METAWWIPVVSLIGGAVLGWFGNWLSSRREEKVQTKRERRQELKQVVAEFLVETDRCWVSSQAKAQSAFALNSAQRSGNPASEQTYRARLDEDFAMAREAVPKARHLLMLLRVLHPSFTGEATQLFETSCGTYHVLKPDASTKARAKAARACEAKARGELAR